MTSPNQTESDHIWMISTFLNLRIRCCHSQDCEGALV